MGAFALFLVAANNVAAAQEALVAAPSPVEASVTQPVAPALEVVAAPPVPAAAPAPSGTPQCPTPAAESGPCIPALTPVKIMIRTHLGSAVSISGQTFAFTLAEPIMVDGKELIPAGTPGMGEVVHAKKSGGMGAAGELVLAARYLEVGGRRLRLRSMNFAQAGQDKMDTAFAASMFVGFAGFLIKGKPIVIPEGVVAQAKTAEPFVLDPPAPAQPVPEPVPEPISPPPTPEQGKTP